MNIIAENREYNLIEDSDDWILIYKKDGTEFRRIAKQYEPEYPLALVAKWGYKPVDIKRIEELDN